MAQLNVIKSGSASDITVTFDALDVASVSYSVYDATGKLIAENQPITINSGVLFVSFSVSGDLNTLTDGKQKDMRRIVVRSETETGRVSETEQFYAVIASFDLVVPSQSFISLMEAKLAAMDMYEADAFLMLNDHTQRQALIEATSRLKAMSFSLKRIYKISDYEYDRPQNILVANTLPFYLAGDFKSDIIDFTELTEDEFKVLPDYFTKDLAQACMIEAVATVKTDGAADAREDGLLSESIGETTNMYRSGRSATKTLSRKTWRLVARYTDNVIRLRRG
ncbi:hypothetical protein [Xenorhabdus hominickii]|uniref:Uncharacterized protein n=1 Tax=Xenorhabdus hominickii TaxID=351679 RepID=A0A1V0M3X0_XENHO|nr:hypothetical protein [Xenorhabdus hominickii]ARD69572.1 hypothetical protein [Xenorhabdus hominickii]PHM52403.1 hypothetical protein Xhom_04481 [Xenorhabdus hominickii]